MYIYVYIGAINSHYSLTPFSTHRRCKMNHDEKYKDDKYWIKKTIYDRLNEFIKPLEEIHKWLEIQKDVDFSKYSIEEVEGEIKTTKEGLEKAIGALQAIKCLCEYKKENK